MTFLVSISPTGLFRQRTLFGTVTTVNTIIWGAIEPCTSVVAACLPLLGPVLLKRHTDSPERAVMSSFFRKSRPIPSAPTARHALQSFESTKALHHAAVVGDDCSTKSAARVSSTSANV